MFENSFYSFHKCLNFWIVIILICHKVVKTVKSSSSFSASSHSSRIFVLVTYTIVFSGIGKNNFPTSSFRKRCGFCSIATSTMLSVRRAVAVNSICFSIKGWQSKSLKYYSTTSLDTFPLCKRIWPQVGLQSSFCISWCLILNISQNSFLLSTVSCFISFWEIQGCKVCVDYCGFAK